MVKSWFLGVYAASPTAILTLPLPHVLRSKRVKVTLNKALNKYDNLLLAGDLNINTLRPTSDSSNHLSDLNGNFSLINLATDSTCFK